MDTKPTADHAVAEPKTFGDTIRVRVFDDYQTLNGYDALKYMRAAPAIEHVAAKKGGRPDQNIRVGIAASAQEMAAMTKVDLDMRVGYLGASGGVASEMVHSVSQNETSIVIIASLNQVVENRNITDERKLHLTGEAAAMLAEDLSGFHREYGGYYCHTVVLGGQVFVTYQLTMTSRADAKKVKVALDGKFENVSTMGSFMASVQAEMSKTAISHRSSLKIHKIGAGGKLPEFDPTKPDEAAKAINDYINDFIALVEKDPKPYYGEYEGYWRRFSNALALRDKIIAKSHVVDDLVDCACAYADLLASINAMLDPANTEGYHVDKGSRAALEALSLDVSGAWKVLQNRYAEMLTFESYRRPPELADLKGRLPGDFAPKVDALRRRLLGQILHGQNVRMHFPVSNLYVAGSSKTLPSGEKPDGDAAPLGDDVWPFLKVARTGAQRFRLRPVGKARDGDALKHGDQVRLEQIDEYKGQQMYNPSGRWAVRTATYVGGEHLKYEWKVLIEGGKAGQSVMTDSTVKLVNMNDQSYMMYPYNDYLTLTKDPGDDRKMHLLHG